MANNGMVSPPEMRKALNPVDGREPPASVEGGRNRLQKIYEGLAFVRKIAKRRRKGDKGDESVVDAFIAERRAESAKVS